jgi:hypothetical protein
MSDEQELKKGIKNLFKQNSELEVLLSAAVIFAALSLNDTIVQWINEALNNNVASNSPILVMAAVIGLYTSTLLPISIVIHFSLRIYWLSLVGLRSVFEQSDLKKDTYYPKFQQKVSRYIDLDRQVNQIDKVSSSIFAFTFLTLFAVSFAVIAFTTLVYLLDGRPAIFETIAVVLFFVSAIDFFTLGLFKRIKSEVFQRFYRPLYFVVSLFTLSFLYRGLYYGLIHLVSRKVLMIALPLYLGLGMLLFNLGYRSNQLSPNEFYRSGIGGEQAVRLYYAEYFTKNSPVYFPHIEKRVVPSGQNYLQLSIPMTSGLEDSLMKACPEIQPFQKTGFHWTEYARFNFSSSNNNFDHGENARQVLTCISDATLIQIDSLEINPGNFVFRQRNDPNKKLIDTFLDIHELSRGDHVLRVQTPVGAGHIFYIPFYLDR